MLSPEETQIVEYGKKQGKTKEQVLAALTAYRSRPQQSQPTFKDYAAGALKGVGQTLAAADSLGATRRVMGKPDTWTGQTTGQRDEALQADNSAEQIGAYGAMGAEILLGGGAGLIKQGASAVARPLANKAKDIASSVSSTGVGQTAVEIAERVPRFMGRMQEKVREAAQRSDKIRSSAPPVSNAIKSGLDERVINTVQQADPTTVKAYKEMVDIADDTSTTLKVKQRPEIVAGRAAEEQYKIIEKQKRAIGQKIGDATARLSKTTKVDVQDGIAAVDDVLSSHGIKVLKTKAGTKLDFSGSGFTPAERTKMQQLYDLATEGGAQLSPSQIRGKDQLFSKLQREARFEGIGDLIVETPQGNMSLFRVFRDVYSNQLDEISPEIKALNRQYRNLVTLTDDVEDSIIKSGKFDTTKNVDAAEFAQTNLRRLLSDAQSAADYRHIVAEMDKVSRTLGYQGANAEELIAFATELRKIYPDAIPATGFTGGIRTSISGMIDKVMEMGAPNTADKQKALRELLESFSGAQ